MGTPDLTGAVAFSSALIGWDVVGMADPQGAVFSVMRLDLTV